MRKWLPIFFVAMLALLFVVLGARPTETPAPQPTTAQPSAPVTQPSAPSAPPAADPQSAPAVALAELSLLASTSESPDRAYDRDGQFGRAWIDVDGNDCDTRNDILQRDLTTYTLEGSCKVLTGVLNDPYTGKTIDFVRGETTSMAVQIDHIIALSWAWQNGAWKWDEDTRILFANDPANLLATDGPTNSSKGDDGPSEWMPLVPTYHCAYSLSVVDVLVKYELTVPQADFLALVRGLETCSA